MLQASSLSFHRHTFSAREASSALPYLNKNNLERDWIDGNGAGVDCTIDILPLALKAWVCSGVKLSTGKTSPALICDPDGRKMKTSRESLPWWHWLRSEVHAISCPCLEIYKERFTCLSIRKRNKRKNYSVLHTSLFSDLYALVIIILYMYKLYKTQLLKEGYQQHFREHHGT